MLFRCFQMKFEKKFQYSDNQKILKAVCEALWDAKFSLSIISEVYEISSVFRRVRNCH